MEDGGEKKEKAGLRPAAEKCVFLGVSAKVGIHNDCECTSKVRARGEAGDGEREDMNRANLSN